MTAAPLPSRLRGGQPEAETLTLDRAGLDGVREALGTSGLALDLGAFRLNVRSDLKALAAQLLAVYPHHLFVVGGAFSDLHVRVQLQRGIRRWIHPQVSLSCDGQQHFHPFPADTALPLLEWGVNWLVAEQMQHLLLLHAGALERDSLVVLLPAVPGSGKSTLTAALAHRGWRLLSDEFGAIDPQTGRAQAVLKPIALKNESIAVIRGFVPEARLGFEFPRTRKGTVCHVAPLPDAVQRRHDSATPTLVLLPKWTPGAATSLTRLEPREVFEALAFNAFNYELQGLRGFDAVVSLARGCEGWRLEYSDLADALPRLEDLWHRAVERRARGQAVGPDPAGDLGGDAAC